MRVCFAAGLIILAACRIIEFPDISSITYQPSSQNEVLPLENPLKVCFSFPVDHDSAENILSVQDYAGTVSGRFVWEKNTLLFIPEPPLKEGSRYVFSFTGVFKDWEGIEYETHHKVPFFSGFINTQIPYLVSVFPLSETIIPADSPIRITFSRRIDPSTFPLGFSLRPQTHYETAWEKGGTEVILSPDSGWENLTLYTLSFSEKITDENGLSLASARDSVFLVQDDTTCPFVVRVEAALNSPSSDFPSLGTELSVFLKGKDAIKITFSEPMDQDTRDSVLLLPKVSGTWHWADRDQVLIFAPSEFYEAGREYELVISADSSDPSGNKLLSCPPLNFTPAVNLLSFSLGFPVDEFALSEDELSLENCREILIPAPVSTHYTFVLDFSGSDFISDEEKLSAQEGINISCIFPPSSPSPLPVGYSWTGNRRLSLTYTGFSASTQLADYYYLLTLQGGPGGIRTSRGNILRETSEQLLKTRGPE